LKFDVTIIQYFSVTGARIVNDTVDLHESDVGTQADMFEITKIGDEYFTWITSEKTTAITVVLRGPSKDIINEVERNIQDAIHCVRNVLLNPKIVPGAGAIEMALSHVIKHHIHNKIRKHNFRH
jgi:T-complex protein 1 subunit gamma